MNKYIILIILGIVLVGGGTFYRVYLLPQDSQPVTTGIERKVTITAVKNQWKFEPEVIEADLGDKVIATIINKDDYDHGIALDAFGISQRMPANETITVTFTVTQPGEYPFYCSVPCGEGEVEGKVRTHYDMVGKLRVIKSGTTLPIPATSNTP